MCVVYSYTLIPNNAGQHLSSCPVPLTPRVPSPETNRVKWLVHKDSSHAEVLVVIEVVSVEVTEVASVEVSAVVTEVASVVETEADVSLSI